ncbi:unnamed protein product [Closterium sp. NIES-53]
MLPAALENLHTAQLRDAHRYEQRQQQGGGKSKPAVTEGQEVYLHTARKDTLDVGLGTKRWKVKEVRGSGVLVLGNEKGERTVDHQTNIAAVKEWQPQQEGPVTRVPESLAPLPRSTVPPCTPCVDARQRAAPHSSSFPPTIAPLQNLHLDVWGPSRVLGPRQERYFLIVVDDYCCYTTVFPLRRKADVLTVLGPLLIARGGVQGLCGLRLHSDRGGEFSSTRLETFC